MGTIIDDVREADSYLIDNGKLMLRRTYYHQLKESGEGLLVMMHDAIVDDAMREVQDPS